jgi:hypothetical protein
VRAKRNTRAERRSYGYWAHRLAALLTVVAFLTQFFPSFDVFAGLGAAFVTLLLSEATLFFILYPVWTLLLGLVSGAREGILKAQVVYRQVGISRARERSRAAVEAAGFALVPTPEAARAFSKALRRHRIGFSGMVAAVGGAFAFVFSFAACEYGMPVALLAPLGTLAVFAAGAVCSAAGGFLASDTLAALDLMASLQRADPEPAQRILMRGELLALATGKSAEIRLELPCRQFPLAVTLVSTTTLRSEERDLHTGDPDFDRATLLQPAPVHQRGDLVCGWLRPDVRAYLVRLLDFGARIGGGSIEVTVAPHERRGLERLLEVLSTLGAFWVRYRALAESSNAERVMGALNEAESDEELRAIVRECASRDEQRPLLEQIGDSVEIPLAARAEALAFRLGRPNPAESLAPVATLLRDGDGALALAVARAEPTSGLEETAQVRVARALADCEVGAGARAEAVALLAALGPAGVEVAGAVWTAWLDGASEAPSARAIDALRWAAEARGLRSEQEEQVKSALRAVEEAVRQRAESMAGRLAVSEEQGDGGLSVVEGEGGLAVLGGEKR